MQYWILRSYDIIIVVLPLHEDSRYHYDLYPAPYVTSSDISTIKQYLFSLKN